MEKGSFHRLFKTTGPAVLPVIHVRSEEQAIRNALLAAGEGAHGVFLINHEFPYIQLLPVIVGVREKLPYLWIGVNFLGVTGDVAFKELGKLSSNGCHVDAYWADNGEVDERKSELQEKAERIKSVREKSGWDGIYFGGTAFKCQRHVQDELLERAASIATKYMDVVTTSGQATGISAGIEKIKRMNAGCKGKALALASGVTPENALDYAPYVDAFLVATGISIDFHNIDPVKLRQLIAVTRSHALTPSLSPSKESWYLSKIAPNTKGDKFAWLDPTSIYIDSHAFFDLTTDLVSQFNAADIDLVAGIDAMGFPLAGSIANRLGKGLLVIRKASKLCVEVDSVTYSCYAGSGKVMEMRKGAFPAGTRILLVDQWIETGGTMLGGIQLVEGQGGVIAGLATICVETNELTNELRSKYKLAHVVPKDVQQLFDDHEFLGKDYMK